jgi:hypothetical protein
VTSFQEILLSAAQQRALKWAGRNFGLRCNSIDYGMQYGVTGAAFDAVCNALERKGLIAGDDGRITDAGEAYLAGLLDMESEDPAAHAGSSFP